MNQEEKQILEKQLKSEQKYLDLPVETIINQVETFKRGILPVKIIRACTIGDGIKIIKPYDQGKYINLFNIALNENRIIKFVPASGAASRMFKSLQSAISNSKTDYRSLKKSAEEGDSESTSVLEFIKNISRFAFYDDLNTIMNKAGLNLEKLKEQGEYKEIFKFILEPAGLGYAAKPKGSIKFHNYPTGARTSFEEHIVEGINYTKSVKGSAKIHFTISPEHEELAISIINPIIKEFKKRRIRINVDYSFQKTETNTVAVNSDNEPFRDNDRKIVFRPGGHGALLSNLHDLQADIIVIKNIDNIVPDHLREETYKYKKLLIGYLAELHSNICNYLNLISENQTSDEILIEIKNYLINELELNISDKFNVLNNTDKKKYLYNLMNRPIRVCGMVKKEKHPGGGPFWVLERDGKITKQVVETTQINLNDKEQSKIFESATHFSPVDFICCVKDYKNQPFNLHLFSDKESGLITMKSKDGRKLKALELPGLWNGGMADWITVFVEVPKSTFNPVKEVNDLLKEEHQPEKSHL